MIGAEHLFDDRQSPVAQCQRLGKIGQRLVDAGELAQGGGDRGMPRAERGLAQGQHALGQFERFDVLSVLGAKVAPGIEMPSLA